MTEPPVGFTEFVAVRSATLLRSAWLLTGDAGKAEVAQTVLAVVWPRWTRVVAGGNPEAYVRQAMWTARRFSRVDRWTLGGTSGGQPIDFHFLFDAGWGHTQLATSTIPCRRPTWLESSTS